MVGCFMVFNATYNNISITGISWHYRWRKPQYTEKTNDLQQITDRLYHKMLYRVLLARAGFERTTLMMIATYSISNYHTITTTTLLQNSMTLTRKGGILSSYQEFMFLSAKRININIITTH